MHLSADIFSGRIIFILMFYRYIPAVERIQAFRFLHNKRLGLLTNEAAKTNDGKPSRVSLMEAGFRIERLFSPEHGISVTHADGQKVEDTKDTLTGIQVNSLYGDRMKPLPAQLEDLDVVLFDVPDVGCRYYTYLWSMTYMMEACNEAGILFVILDRPNPIGGDLSMAEGPMLNEENCSSFIGRWDIPIRHCCTLGELAIFFQRSRMPMLQLEVIPCENWDRTRSFFEAGTSFVPTSPAIGDAETALLYPGTGLLEGIHVSEGRGTGFPFKQSGAPWINSPQWKYAVESMGIEGISISEVHFKPEWGLYAGVECNGLRFEVIDMANFRPVGFGIKLIRGLMECFPGYTHPRLYPTAANPSGVAHLDKLLGIKDAFQILQNDPNRVSTDCPVWKKTIEPFLLY